MNAFVCASARLYVHRCACKFGWCVLLYMFVHGHAAVFQFIQPSLTERSYFGIARRQDRKQER